MKNSKPEQATKRVATWQRFIDAQRKSGPILGWSLAVGATAGLIGALFRMSISAVESGLEQMAGQSQAAGMPEWVFPVISGALLVGGAVWLVRKFAPEAGGSGVQEIEGNLDNSLPPIRWRRVLPVKFIGGVSSLGAGMLLGREGPTIQIGGAIGRMFSDLFRRSEQDAHVLLAAGAGAGLAAAFNAPLAGLLLVIEEMRPKFRYSITSVQCVFAACIAADVVLRLVLGSQAVIPMAAMPVLPATDMWHFVYLGVIFGLFGVAFNAALLFSVDLFNRIPEGLRWLAGAGVGAFIGLLAVFNADLVGGGYETISNALGGQFLAGALMLFFLARFILTVLCYSSGAPGGIFAPMLALGTLLGMWVGDVAHSFFAQPVPASIYVVAGMGALFSATVRAPITGIILVIELTGSFGQFLPVMITCFVATVVAQWLGGRPIYTDLLERSLKREEKGLANDPPR